MRNNLRYTISDAPSICDAPPIRKRFDSRTIRDAIRERFNSRFADYLIRKLFAIRSLFDSQKSLNSSSNLKVLLMSRAVPQ